MEAGRLSLWYARAMMAVILACMAIGIYWWWLDYELNVSPLRISSEVLADAAPGGAAVLRYRWQVQRECPREVALWLVNGKTHQIRRHHGTSSTQRNPREAVVEVPIPAGMPPGPATVRSVSVFRCNPLRSWRLTHDTPILILPAT